MGRYMRKVSSKSTTTSTSEPPHQMDHQHHCSLGVRTRARTLALLQKKTLPPPPSVDPNSYLQLRTRRLPKVPPFSQTKTSHEGHACKGPSSARNLQSCRGKVAHCCAGNPNLAMDDELELEASFGENVLEPETGERNLRETTPCSPIIKSGIRTTPGSATRRTASNSREKIQVVENQMVPSAVAIEQFFHAEEQSQMMRFVEKYNYDPVNDCPMPGRYEWMRLDA